MTSFGVADSSQSRGGLIRLNVLSGVEAEVIKTALERFQLEKLEVSPSTYEVSIYFEGGQYIVLFNKSKNTPPGTMDPAYEVVISSETLKVIHSQFSR